LLKKSYKTFQVNPNNPGVPKIMRAFNFTLKDFIFVSVHTVLRSDFLFLVDIVLSARSVLQNQFPK